MITASVKDKDTGKTYSDSCTVIVRSSRYLAVKQKADLKAIGLFNENSVKFTVSDKKIASVKHKSVNKRFKETRFAAGANRQFMSLIEKAGMEWDEFVDVSLASLVKIADEIGL